MATMNFRNQARSEEVTVSYISVLRHTLIKAPLPLMVLRITWITIIGLYLFMAILGVPLIYQSFTVENAPAIAPNETGIHSTAHGIYYTATLIFAIVFATAASSLIFYRISNSWLVAFVTLTFPIAAITPSNMHQIVVIAYPQLQLLIWGMVYIALMVYTLFGFIFPDGKFVPHKSRWLIPFFALFWFFTLPHYIEIELAKTQRVWLVHTLNASMAAVGIMSIVAQYWRYRNASVRMQQQLKWAIFGAVIWFGTFISRITVFNLFIPQIDNMAWKAFVQLVVSPLPNLGIIIAVSFLSFAIFRYQLWTVDVVINRSLVTAIITVVLALLFSVIAFMLQELLQAENTLLAYGLSALVCFVSFDVIRKRVRHFVDHRLYNFRFDANEVREAQILPDTLRRGTLTGETIGAYVVEGLLGFGGMGEVYKGMANGKTAAIKILLPQILRDPDTLHRFEREILVGRMLNHDNIVKVYDSGIHKDMPYMIMEYIEGQDLGKKIKQGGMLKFETALSIMNDICSALHIAHSNNFIHRDIKPTNIMIRSNGKAVLMDFGIMKISQSNVTSITGSAAIGTIGYMAPEQLMASQSVDHRADIYGFGVLLYEMLTCQLPFRGGIMEMMFAQARQIPDDPRLLQPDIPENVAEAILKALEKDPDDRFQSATEFAAALQN